MPSRDLQLRPADAAIDVPEEDGVEHRPRGVVPALARVLLLAAAPLSMIWFPVAVLPGAGNVAATDAALIAVWAITLADMAVRGISSQDVYTPLIVALALCIGVLAALASQLGPVPGSSVLEFQGFMKRFGLSAILPLAASRFRTPAMLRWTRLLTVATVALLVVFTLWPELRDSLPRPDEFDPFRSGERATGTLTNPNDLAYAAVTLTVMHAALLPRGSGLLTRALFVATAAGAAWCVVESGSRSAIVGLAAAVLFLVFRSALAWWAKLSLVIATAGTIVGGLVSSEVFRERVESVYAMGTSEENVAARVEMQSMMVRTWQRYPLGVGYRNFENAAGRESKSYFHGTSDSVYLDTLLGAGALGLIALLLLLGTAWRVVSAAAAGRANASILQAGLVAFMVFGSATVIPISVYLAPLFFTLVATGVYARGDR